MTTDLTLRTNPAAVVEWLVARRPAETDKALVSLASQQNVVLEVKYRGSYPTGPYGERLPSYTVAIGCAVGGAAKDIEKVAQRVESALVPAPNALIEEWLAELSVLVPRRPTDEFTGALTLSAYTSRLASYPADVVREVLLVCTWKFWPSWHELQGICERLASPRRQMLSGLRQSAKRPPASEAVLPRASPDKTKRILEELGFTPRRFAPVPPRRADEAPADRRAEPAERPPPHWSKTVDPEGPEMQALRAARLANPLMRELLEAGARDTTASENDEPEAPDERDEQSRLSRAS